MPSPFRQVPYGPLGERRHRSPADSAFRYRELLRVLEDDALRLRRSYRRMK